ncbi:alpha/beta hydrolase [Lysobacter cavernae]|uniref:Alpha/beta hydrolase n=1 Tax=Lysobacter cavernae TaxID=1685901 RepID=A0ABV7RSX8_9GAMM
MNTTSLPVPEARSTARRIPWIQDDWRTASLRTGMQALSTLAPPLAVRIVDRLWFTPPRLPLRPEAAEFLARGERLSFRVHGRHVAGWAWGQGPTVLLVHGWGGRAAQMCAFVEPLLAAGLRVLAFDAPAHGESDSSRLGGRRVSFIEFAAALREVARAGAPVIGLIAHSSGCTATALAIRDGWAPPPRLVFLAPFVFPDRYSAPFAAAVGASAAVMAAFRARTEQRLRRPWSDFDMPGLPQNFTVPPLLLVHDGDDLEVPITDSRALAKAWPRARLLSTSGLGHRKLLREPSVVAVAVAAMTEAAESTAADAPAEYSPAQSRGELDRYFQQAEFCG